jgi:Zn-dependent protease with chaperone function
MNALGWTFALNIALNSIFSFVTAALLVQLLIFLLRIKSGRMRVFLLSIPFLKLVIDPFFYNFENWALTHQIDPWQLEAGTRNFSVMLLYLPGFPSTAIWFSTNQGLTFTLADLAALALPSPLIKGAIVFLALFSLVSIGHFLLSLYHSANALKRLRQGAKPCLRPVAKQMLAAQLRGVELILSDKIAAPCAFRGAICLPAQLLNQLSQEEYEAILVHEVEHLRWHDSPVRLAIRGISALFWWVPAQWLREKIEFYQERGCDEKMGRYQISPLDLAAAIVKSAKGSFTPLLSTSFAPKGGLSKRLELLFDERGSRFWWLGYPAALLAALSILLGKFWIF